MVANDFSGLLEKLLVNPETMEIQLENIISHLNMKVIDIHESTSIEPMWKQAQMALMTEILQDIKLITTKPMGTMQ